MSAEGNSLEKQAVLCTLLGPFILLITLIILLINPVRQSPIIPIVSLISFAACWQWKMRGLIGALVCLAGLFVYQFLNSAPAAIFWELLLTASVALTLSITALCSLDVQELFARHSLDALETASKHQDFVAIKEKLQASIERMQFIEEEKANEISLALAQADELQQKINVQTTLLQTHEKEFSATQEKMRNIITQNENLLRELFQKRHECEKLRDQLEGCKLEIKELKEMEELYNLQEQESSSQRQNFSDMEEKVRLATTQMQLLEEQKTKEIDSVLAQVSQLQQKLDAQAVLLQTREEEFSHAQEKIESITTQNENLLKELFQKRHECDKFAGQLETYIRENKVLKDEISSAVAATPQIVEVAVAGKLDELKPVSPSPSPKRAKGKSSKTNNWANAIMSRWSEPDT